MKLKHIVVGSALSVLMAAPAMAQQAAMAQSSAPASQDSVKTQSSSQEGSMHPGVRAVQKKLKGQGYDIGSVDGLWGARSENALKKFQRANSLQTTGTLDHKTANALGVTSSQFAAFESEVGKSSANKSASAMKGGNSTGSGSSMGGSGTMGSGGSSMNGSPSTSGGHAMGGTKPMNGSNATGSGNY